IPLLTDTNATFLEIIIAQTAANLPWTLGVLWTLHAGMRYGALLVLTAGLLVARPQLANTGMSDAVGMLVFSAALIAYPLDVRLRRLSSVAFFIIGAFCAPAMRASLS